MIHIDGWILIFLSITTFNQFHISAVAISDLTPIKFNGFFLDVLGKKSLSIDKSKLITNSIANVSVTNGGKILLRNLAVKQPSYQNKYVAPRRILKLRKNNSTSLKLLSKNKDAKIFKSSTKIPDNTTDPSETLADLNHSINASPFVPARHKDGTFEISNILKSLLETYDVRLRPNFGGDPVYVGISLRISNFDSMSEVNMDYTITLLLYQYWRDDRLDWGGNPNTRISLPASVSEAIWVPDTFIANDKNSFLHEITETNKLIWLYGDGTIIYGLRFTTTLACMMNLRNYPLDEQNCTVEIESYGYTTSDVIMYWHGNESVEGLNEMSVSVFDLKDHNVITTLESLPTGDYQRLSLSFHFKRNIGYFIFHTYLPTILIVLLSWVSFWINHEATSARIALGPIFMYQLGITTVLTMTTISSGVRSTLPRISYVKAIDIYLVVCFMFVFAALLEYAAVNYTYWGSKIRETKLSQEKFPSKKVSNSDKNRKRLSPTLINNNNGTDTKLQWAAQYLRRAGKNSIFGHSTLLNGASHHLTTHKWRTTGKKTTPNVMCNVGAQKRKSIVAKLMQPAKDKVFKEKLSVNHKKNNVVRDFKPTSNEGSIKEKRETLTDDDMLYVLHLKPVPMLVRGTGEIYASDDVIIKETEEKNGQTQSSTPKQSVIAQMLGVKKKPSFRLMPTRLSQAAHYKNMMDKSVLSHWDLLNPWTSSIIENSGESYATDKHSRVDPEMKEENACEPTLPIKQSKSFADFRGSPNLMAPQDIMDSIETETADKEPGKMKKALIFDKYCNDQQHNKQQPARKNHNFLMSQYHDSNELLGGRRFKKMATGVGGQFKHQAKRLKQLIPVITNVNVIDRYSRIIFPVSFLLFNIVYWFYYGCKSNKCF